MGLSDHFRSRVGSLGHISAFVFFFQIVSIFSSFLKLFFLPCYSYKAATRGNEQLLVLKAGPEIMRSALLYNHGKQLTLDKTEIFNDILK